MYGPMQKVASAPADRTETSVTKTIEAPNLDRTSTAARPVAAALQSDVLVAPATSSTKMASLPAIRVASDWIVGASSGPQSWSIPVRCRRFLGGHRTK